MITKISEISSLFSITDKESYCEILKHSNKIKIKLLHEVDGEIFIPETIFERISVAINKTENLLTKIEYIIEQADDKIPFGKEPHIYYLFDNTEIIYIGQTFAIAGRINEHLSNGKKFTKVYCEQVDRRKINLIEKLYIHRDSPKLNVAVISNAEHLKEILLITEIDEFI